MTFIADFGAWRRFQGQEHEDNMIAGYVLLRSCYRICYRICCRICSVDNMFAGCVTGYVLLIQTRRNLLTCLQVNILYVQASPSSLALDERYLDFETVHFEILHYASWKGKERNIMATNKNRAFFWNAGIFSTMPCLPISDYCWHLPLTTCSGI